MANVTFTLSDFRVTAAQAREILLESIDLIGSADTRIAMRKSLFASSLWCELNRQGGSIVNLAELVHLARDAWSEIADG